MEISEKIERYFAEENRFRGGINLLRDIAIKSGAMETYKWNAPVYTIDGKNVFWIAHFKNHFGLGFFNGVFLKDPKKVLINVQEQKTQAMRHWRFSSLKDIDEKSVLAYIKEAIENQKNGRQLSPVRNKKEPVGVPALLNEALNKSTAIKNAFKSLTPYKQNEYSEYIINAKQEKTKLSRLEKILPMIMDGKGLNDKYR